MNIPPDVNTRAEDMWRIISQKVDFRNKNVLDIGCGHGEMLWRAFVSGADYVEGIDINVVQLKEFHPVSYRTNFDIRVSKKDINEIVLIYDKSGHTLEWLNDFDIAFCFSVLPYLANIQLTLKWMSHNFPLCLIEAQYIPEPYNIGVEDDYAMHSLLLEHFKYVQLLGKTYVKIRDTYRTIWSCSNNEEVS